jgi:hypothetical protein
MKKLLAAVLVFSAGCAAPERAADSTANPRERAFTAFDRLQASLGGRLMREMKNGRVGALSACNTEAGGLSDAVRSGAGFELGRTSHRVRNPNNAPRDWVRPYLKASAGNPVSTVKAASVDLGDRTGILRPIGVKSLCLGCHGDPRRFPEPLRKRLSELYPQDEATGFEVGEFRGYFWAEVPKSP